MRMRGIVGLLLSLWLVSFSAEAKQRPTTQRCNKDQQTRHWEKRVLSSLHTILCGTKGQFTSTFQLSSDDCSKTYWSAANQCRTSMRKLSFYKVFNHKSGKLWGRYLGLCIGIAFNVKYVLRKAIPGQ